MVATTSHKQSETDPIAACLQKVKGARFSPLDLLPRRTLVEKLIELVLSGSPVGSGAMKNYLDEMSRVVQAVDTSDLNVVVFGGGSGLSNVVGGDANNAEWRDKPFSGLKTLFPKTKSVVCVTDDGGSTGELLKDLPLIALGDIRHVMVSSIQKTRLVQKYNVRNSLRVAGCLQRLFNYRFTVPPSSVDALLAGFSGDFGLLPPQLGAALRELLDFIFIDPRLKVTLSRPHCLGNLLLAAAIYRQVEPTALKPTSEAMVAGIHWLSELLGCGEESVLPCTTTSAHLNVLYSNGVLVAGESKSSLGRRNAAIDRVFVEFAGEPHVPDGVIEAIGAADLILFAPGSLYTSIIPVMQLPAIPRAIRKNSKALKVLVANLWVQKGETDLVWNDMRRRFHVSDMINAYDRNIPGGVAELFSQVLLLGLQDIPGSILQSYAVEEKVPIFLDRDAVWKQGLLPIEAKIFSESALKHRLVQHDPENLARAMKTLWAVRNHAQREDVVRVAADNGDDAILVCNNRLTPDERLHEFARILEIPMEDAVRKALLALIWNHRDIRRDHFQNVRGVALLGQSDWQRNQQWDRMCSYFDPEDGLIKIREDVFHDPARQELALLVGLGQSLLGNYARDKGMFPIEVEGDRVGQMYMLTLQSSEEWQSFFTPEEVVTYLHLVRMRRMENEDVFTRLVNGEEGFTPPGMLMGLIFAWYLDNSLAAHIEYKMSITRLPGSSLVPEQIKMLERRKQMIAFFRTVVFRHNSPLSS
ncbi:MAG: YvcK family protein [Desulfobulbaceae bacterium]|jgi:uncharacterized cofD-like protein|nr:YvcK family protein [Desulfobulbaceae bacterium]